MGENLVKWIKLILPKDTLNANFWRSCLIRQSLCRCDGSEWALNPMTRVLTRRKRFEHRRRYREEGPRTVKATQGDVAARQGSQVLPATTWRYEKAKKEFSRDFRMGMAVQNPWFHIRNLQNCDRISFCCFMPLTCSYCSPRKLAHLVFSHQVAESKGASFSIQNTKVPGV